MIHYLGAEELKAAEEAMVRGVAPTEADTPAPASTSQRNASLGPSAHLQINANILYKED